MKNKTNCYIKQDKPTIRIVHNLARTGGTLISKCLGCMNDVILLSEIHPAGSQLYNPIQQAHEWFNLITPADFNTIKTKKNYSFLDAIELISKRCNKKNKTLIIRDWSHLDFMAIPYLSYPSHHLTITKVLQKKFTTIDTITVRHPIDQWLSLRKLAVMKNKLTVDMFLHGYLNFAKYAVQYGFVRFEDFVRCPDAELTTLCARLDLPFDSQYKQRWSTYNKITGDFSGSNKEITPLPRKDHEAGLVEIFERNDDYQKAIEMLGYESQA